MTVLIAPTTVYILSIWTPQLLTRLVLKCEQIQFTTIVVSKNCLMSGKQCRILMRRRNLRPSGFTLFAQACLSKCFGIYVGFGKKKLDSLYFCIKLHSWIVSELC